MPRPTSKNEQHKNTVQYGKLRVGMLHMVQDGIQIDIVKSSKKTITPQQEWPMGPVILDEEALCFKLSTDCGVTTGLTVGRGALGRLDLRTRGTPHTGKGGWPGRRL
jgi:hypothetical protein